MSGHFTARAFKCYVTKFDPHKDWKKKDIPQVCATAHKKANGFFNVTHCMQLLHRVHFL